MSAPLVRQPLDTIYARIGLGPFQFFSLFFVGCIYISESMMNIFSYVLAQSIKDEWNLDPWQVTALSVARDVGIIITGLTVPWLGDKYGRLSVMKWGLLLKTASLMLAVVSLSFPWLLLGLFCLGLGLGFNRPAVSTYSIEILQPRFRGAMLIGLFVFIISGAIGGAAVAIYMVPMLDPTHWRMLLFLAVVPTIGGMLAANILFVEPPRYLAMIGKTDKAIKVFNFIARFNCKPTLSHEEIAQVRAVTIKDTPYDAGECRQRIWNDKYRPRFIYLALMWFLTGYQNSTIFSSFPENLSNYLNNPLMAVEISTLPIAVFIPLPFVEMPDIGRRWTFLGFVLIQIASTFVAAITSNQIVFVCCLLTLLFAITFSFRILYPLTLELFDTSIRCYTFGLCYAIARIGGLCSRWQDTVLHDPGLAVMLSLNFIAMMAIFHYPYETCQKPLDDYEKA